MSKRSVTSPIYKEWSKKQKITTTSKFSNQNLAAIEPLPLSPWSDSPSLMDLKGDGFPTHAVAKEQVKKSITKKAPPPIADIFEPWTPPTTQIPEKAEAHWGVKPTMVDVTSEGENALAHQVPHPLPHPDQPSARTSNAATNPPLWEDQGIRFRRGSRYVKWTSATRPKKADTLLADIDQEQYLQIRLLDMRPKSKSDPTPRRKPVVYHYGVDLKDKNGKANKLGRKPKDWNDGQAIKGLNDRRGRAIARIVQDEHWSFQEREYLASLFREFPDASIWEISARHNDRFMGKDFTRGASTCGGFALYDRLSTGRTVESVRQQYLMYKPEYDRGQAPAKVRISNDNSAFAREMRRKWLAACVSKGPGGRIGFGLPDPALESAYDEPVQVQQLEDETENAYDEPAQVQRFEDETESTVDEQPIAHESEEALEEELLRLGGYYNDQYVSDEALASALDGMFSPLAASDQERRAESLGMENAVELASCAQPKRMASEIFQARMQKIDQDYSDHEAVE